MYGILFPLFHSLLFLLVDGLQVKITPIISLSAFPLWWIVLRFYMLNECLVYTFLQIVCAVAYVVWWGNVAVDWFWLQF